MNIDWSLYESRVYANGLTKTDRNVQRIKSNIIDKLDGNPSYKTTIIGDTENTQILLVNETDKPDIKEILSLPEEIFSAGEYIKLFDKTWLIIKRDLDNTIQTKGEIQECNWTIKTQKADGTIISYPCIDKKGSGSLGVDQGKVMSLGDAVHTLTLPLDENTIEFRNDKRFFLDKHPTKPTPYKITDVDSTSKDGLIVLTVQRDLLKDADIDRVDLGICDYFSPTPPPTPTPTGDSSIITYSGTPTIKLGSSYKLFTCTAYDASNNIVSITPVWNITVLPEFTSYVHYTTKDNTIKIKVDYNIAMNNTKMKLEVSDFMGKYKSSIYIDIVSGV